MNTVIKSIIDPDFGPLDLVETRTKVSVLGWPKKAAVHRSWERPKEGGPGTLTIDDADGTPYAAAENAVASEQIAKLRIKAGSPAQLAGRLSGGNQQKVVISKWLVRGARVFLFDEPTRGIDVGAKAEVFETMDQLVRNGAAVLMVSSELPELLQVADRILVMRAGAISGELPGRTTQEEIMHLATSR